MTAAAFSKATWIQGTFQFVKGNGEETISMQPVALPTITLRAERLRDEPHGERLGAALARAVAPARNIRASSRASTR